MKLSFEGTTYQAILDEMESVLAASNMSRQQAVKNILETVSENATTTALPSAAPVTEPQGPGLDLFPVETPVDKPVENPVEKPGRTPKQLENDERLRVRAQEKAAAKKAAKKAAPAPAPEPVAPPPPPKTAEAIDPAEVVKIRQKTIEDLQSAYANGFQKEVFDLLSRFGNGAKSFRELPPDAFVPIREAIDNGALT